MLFRSSLSLSHSLHLLSPLLSQIGRVCIPYVPTENNAFHRCIRYCAWTACDIITVTAYIFNSLFIYLFVYLFIYLFTYLFILYLLTCLLAFFLTFLSIFIHIFLDSKSSNFHLIYRLLQSIFVFCLSDSDIKSD